jgi:hypothetical protein
MSELCSWIGTIYNQFYTISTFDIILFKFGVLKGQGYVHLPMNRISMMDPKALRHMNPTNFRLFHTRHIKQSFICEGDYITLEPHSWFDISLSPFH